MTASPYHAAMIESGTVVALSGGIGGAKLALGLARVLEPGRLTIVANTGDDFHHLGLAISPDIDTLLYTLSGLADPERGWGRRDETWNFMSALAAFGGETWFRLGDRDLALHVERTRRLAAGETLSAIVDALRRVLRIATSVVPMSDDPVRTLLRTDEDWIDFQDYFVRRRCEPRVREVRYEGALTARPAEPVLNALRDPELRAVVICPSNPFLSIEPMLAVPGLRAALDACAAPIVAVSPIVGGHSVKGPTAKIMREIGIEVSASAVAHRYADLIDGFIVDEADANAAVPEGVVLKAAKAIMTTLEDREALALAVLAVADRIET